MSIIGNDDKKKKQQKMSRPFGVALLLAGYDDKGSQLYFSDPSGTYMRYKAKAIGAGSEGDFTILTPYSVSFYVIVDKLKQVPNQHYRINIETI